MISVRITLNISQWICEEPQIRRQCDVPMDFDGGAMTFYEKQ